LLARLDFPGILERKQPGWGTVPPCRRLFRHGPVQRP
jgi:hypothetical protein